MQEGIPQPEISGKLFSLYGVRERLSFRLAYVGDSAAVKLIKTDEHELLQRFHKVEPGREYRFAGRRIRSFALVCRSVTIYPVQPTRCPLPSHREEESVSKSCAGDRPEAKAKAALLDFLRSRGLLTGKVTATAELILDKYSARADVVMCDPTDFHCFEIKTERDTLIRLERQLEVYNRYADFVTIVAATKHITTIISRVSSHVGIYELVGFDCTHPIRVFREPERSPSRDVDAMLSLLPVTELQARFALSGRLNRQDAIMQAIELPEQVKKQAVLAFLAERYGPNSRTLLRTTRRRKIRADDLAILRRWNQADRATETENLLRICDGMRPRCQDAEVYSHVGQSFGPVPAELRALLAG